jgi:hypothetical protein
MEASDIAKITYELIRLRSDQMQMSWEDERSHFFRFQLLTQLKLYKQKQKLKKLKFEYDELYNKVNKSYRSTKNVNIPSSNVGNLNTSRFSIESNNFEQIINKYENTKKINENEVSKLSLIMIDLSNDSPKETPKKILNYHNEKEITTSKTSKNENKIMNKINNEKIINDNNLKVNLNNSILSPDFLNLSNATLIKQSICNSNNHNKYNFKYNISKANDSKNNNDLDDNNNNNHNDVNINKKQTLTHEVFYVVTRNIRLACKI